MEDVRIILSALWVATMLTYLLGDVLRIFSGNFVLGGIGSMKLTEVMWLGIAVFMVIPVIMVVLSLTLPYPMSRWANIIVAIVFFGFNLLSLSDYSISDKFLLIVSMGFNLMTAWYAWNWV
jgi:hypothetical protein